MKFFLTISLLCALMLAIHGPGTQQKVTLSPKSITMPIKNETKIELLATFENARNAHAFWAFLTGDKKSVSHQLKSQFDDLELGFLFSPSGLHFAAFFLLLFLFAKKFLSKKNSSRFKFFFSLCFYFFPSFAIKRIVILKTLLFLKQRLKKTWSLEVLFFVTFLFSFSAGHYFKSPMGFLMSFLFMGTFIGLRNESRAALLIGLFSSHLLLGFFSGKEISPVALVLNLGLIAYFSGMMSLAGLYLASFKWIHINWFEKIISLFLWLIKKSALICQGTHVNASVFLILGLWLILFKKDKKWIALCFLLHANLAYTPSLFVFR